jgi:hypothetical protein
MLKVWRVHEVGYIAVVTLFHLEPRHMQIAEGFTIHGYTDEMDREKHSLTLHQRGPDRATSPKVTRVTSRLRSTAKKY